MSNKEIKITKIVTDILKIWKYYKRILYCSQMENLDTIKIKFKLPKLTEGEEGELNSLRIFGGNKE